MSNVEGEGFNLEDLEMLSDELAPVEAVPESIEPVAVQVEPESVDRQEEGAIPPAESGPSKLPLYIEWGSAIGVSVILLAVAVLGVVHLSSALYLISVAAVFYAIWRSRATSSIYTVLLGCALVAILTAVYCLWTEIGRYQFDLRARDAKQRVVVSQPADSALLAQTDRFPLSV